MRLNYNMITFMTNIVRGPVHRRGRSRGESEEEEEEEEEAKMRS